jgi:hypothetical protein
MLLYILFDQPSFLLSAHIVLLTLALIVRVGVLGGYILNACSQRFNYRISVFFMHAYAGKGD